jgi:hypothetical protein
MESGRQVAKVMGQSSEPGVMPRGIELVIPNPNLKLMDQVREVMRVRHYAIRTEQAYCDWIRRYIRFHRMRSREELLDGTGKVELFLSDLAVHGNVAVSTQNQAWKRRTSNIQLPTSNFELQRVSSWRWQIAGEGKGTER